MYSTHAQYAHPWWSASSQIPYLAKRAQTFLSLLLYVCSYFDILKIFMGWHPQEYLPPNYLIIKQPINCFTILSIRRSCLNPLSFAFERCPRKKDRILDYMEISYPLQLPTSSRGLFTGLLKKTASIKQANQPTTTAVSCISTALSSNQIPFNFVFLN